MSLKTIFTKNKSILSYIYKILIAISLILLIIFLFNQCKKSPTQAYLQTTIDSLGQVIKQYKDDSGRLHTELEQRFLSSEEANKLIGKKLDSTSKVLKIKDKQITSLTELVIITKNQGKGKTKFITKYDTTYLPGEIVLTPVDTSFNADINDGYLNFGITIDSSGYLYSYTYKDSLNLVTYSRPTGFLGLGKKKNYLDISSYNTNSETKVKQYIIKDKYIERIIGSIGFSYVFNGTKFIVMPGISLGYRLFGIKFKKK